MRALLVIVFYAASIALPVAAIVWAVNISRSVHTIEQTLTRMAERQQTVVVARPAEPAAPAPTSAPIDIEPFVD
jgi:hypothetical protein